MSDTLVTVPASDAALIQQAAPEQAAPRKRRNRPRKQQNTGAPDYANMSSADLLLAWEGYVKADMSDAATVLLNSIGEQAAAQVKAELSGLVSVAIGLRKAYGRGVKVADLRKLLPSVTIPDGFNPTFGLFLQAARLRPDDSAERKVSADIRSGLRAHIRGLRKQK